MIGRRLAGSAAIVAIGYAIAGGLFWSLLNVPESNVLALLASLLLVVATVLCAGVTTGSAAAALAGHTARQWLVSGLRAIPGFVVGLVCFAIVWWASGVSLDWWAVHRGEVDAIWLRYLRSDRTAAVHAVATWTIWLIRWAVGLSIVGGLTVAAATGGSAGRGVASELRTGLRSGLSAAPLAAIGIAAALYVEGAWRFAYWRPARLTPSIAEIVFAAAKFAALYLVFVALTIAAIGVLARTVQRRSTAWQTTGTA